MSGSVSSCRPLVLLPRCSSWSHHAVCVVDSKTQRPFFPTCFHDSVKLLITAVALQAGLLPLNLPQRQPNVLSSSPTVSIYAERYHVNYGTCSQPCLQVRLTFVLIRLRLFLD